MEEALVSKVKFNRLFRKAGLLSGMTVSLLLLSFAVWTYFLEPSQGIEAALRPKALAIGCLCLILTIYCFFRSDYRYKNSHLTLISINVIYLLSELVCYFLISFGLLQNPVAKQDGSFGFFNGACATYDSIAGYRWLDKDCRVVKVANNHLVFDQTFRPNNKGYLSQQDYQEQRTDSTTKRFIVFGDSFTAPEFLESYWPDRVQEQLNRVSTTNYYEFYSFAIDGGGISNWHRIFTREIIPNYDFDGIIFAIYGNDLDRDFFMMHHTDSILYSGYAATIPESEVDFQSNYLPDLWWSQSIVSDQWINHKLDQLKQVQNQSGFQWTRPNLYALYYLYGSVQQITYLYKKRNYEDKYVHQKNTQVKGMARRDLEKKYGKQKTKLLSDMIQYCQKHQKRIILSAIPDENGIRHIQSGQSNILQAELSFLAEDYNIDYFDGFEVFMHLSEPELKKCFLKFDPHWSQTGSDLFAEKFSNYLFDTNEGTTD